jgi:AcrR family transcriptional regulator
MSFDIAVWEGPRPASDQEAEALFADLADRYLEGDPSAPTEAIVAFVRELVEVYPDDLPDERVDDECIWASMPVLGDAAGPIAYLTIRWSDAERATPTIAALARRRGLVCFDPQSSALL